MFYKAVFFLFALCDYASPMVCRSRVCYGYMQDLTRKFRSHVDFFVRPENYSSCLPEDCLTKLISGQKLECNGETSSILYEDEPWYVPPNVHLKPACKETQTLVRQSKPEVDFEMTDIVTATKIVASDKHSPCTILKMGNVNVSIDSFILDNNLCTCAIKGSLPLWFQSAVSLLTSWPVIENVKLSNLMGKSSPALIHIGSQNKWGHPVLMKNVNVFDITNGSIQIEAVRGDVVFRNVEEVIQNCLPQYSNNFLFTNVSSIVNVASYYGFSQILGSSDPTDKMPCEDDKDSYCKNNTAYVVIVPSFLAFFLVMTCLCLCCKLDRRNDGHSHIN